MVGMIPKQDTGPRFVLFLHDTAGWDTVSCINRRPSERRESPPIFLFFSSSFG